MSIEEIYEESKPLVINDCEFAHQIDDIMYSSKNKVEIKEETSSTTNIIVTKYADSTLDMLDVEQSLDLGNKEKIIEVELLPTNLEHKSNFTALLNGTVIKKSLKSKIESDENNKFSHISVKKKKLKQYSNKVKEIIKNNLVIKSDIIEKSSEEVICSECNKKFPSTALLKKHLSTCKVHSLRAALCSKCGKHFSSNYNLKRHMTSCKLCPDHERSPRYICQCGRTYSQEWDMKKHKIKCKDGKKKCKPCMVTDCNLLFYHKTQLIAHMKKDHNMTIQDPVVLNFNSFEEFQIWKEKEEEETFTYYSKQTGSNTSRASINTYYVCQHDGSDRTHTSAPRKTERRNKKGRIKTGRLCWSQMNVKEFLKDRKVKVTYFPSHTHPLSITDTEHHPLPSSITMEIKRRISEMAKLNENEVQSLESQELGKGRRKRCGMSLRTLKALARKNRSLFRITAQAMQSTDGSEDTLEANFKTNFQLPLSASATSSGNVMQVFVTNQEDEIADDPDSLQVFDNNNESESGNSNEELLEDCINYLNNVKTQLLSGKVPKSLLLQIKESLKSMCDLWKNEVSDNPTVEKPQNLSECQEVMMYQPQSPLPVAEIFPLQDEMNVNVEETSDLKKFEPLPEKAVYQIIAVDGEEKATNEFLYQNTVELVGTPEFIIIADHPQLFQSVDSNIQFDLN